MLPTFERLADTAAWYDAWLRDAALPLWAGEGVDARRGSFQEKLSPEGKALPAPRRGRVQARQIWSFAIAGQEGFGGAYGEVAARGLAFYQRHYRRPDGLYVFAADAEGRVTDGRAALYEQAFALLALAGMGEAKAAAETRLALEALRHPAGGWREVGDQPFQANAHMHLFEAALAWEPAGGAAWAQMADEIAELALTRFIAPDTGLLREFFDSDWRALPEPSGGLVEPGHQFEWAWLLDTWGGRRGEPRGRVAARRLYEHGRRGVDPARDVVVGAVWADGSVRDPTARLWAQTEHLRAALCFGSDAEALQAASGLAGFLQTPARGAWRDKLKPDGSFVEEPAPATSLYHLVAGLLPLIRSA
jgi:mannose-6-phosphate isomerase